MLDRDFSGKMGFNEFKELWGALNQWKVLYFYCFIVKHMIFFFQFFQINEFHFI